MPDSSLQKLSCCDLCIKRLLNKVALCAATLIVSIFIFVQQLRFNVNNLAGIFIVIGMIMTSLNLSAGGRALGAALLGVTCWGIVLGGAMVSYLIELSVSHHHAPIVSKQWYHCGPVRVF